MLLAKLVASRWPSPLFRLYSILPRRPTSEQSRHSQFTPTHWTASVSPGTTPILTTSKIALVKILKDSPIRHYRLPTPQFCGLGRLIQDSQTCVGSRSRNRTPRATILLLFEHPKLIRWWHSKTETRIINGRSKNYMIRRGEGKSKAPLAHRVPHSS
ncbi:hypothetical protein BJV74DRAFT_128634 [Russula compacta]|nr:hypothetical protein BJV74DRAFT_128634 [Russula compacta]